MPNEERVTQKELARRLGITTRQVRNLHEKGLPRITRGPDKGLYRWDEAHRWYKKWLREEKERRTREPTDLNLETERARKTAAQAEMAELELAKLHGELIPAEVFDEVIGELADRLMSKLKNLPGAWADQVAGLESPRQVVKVLRAAISEAVEELQSVVDEALDAYD